MTTEATATQGFHNWSRAEQLAWAEEQLKLNGLHPIAGGEAPDATAQPPASGQGDPGSGGTGEAKGGDGFNWGLFPDVPEEQRPLLEPHLSKVQGHVTKLEQQLANFKDVDPQQAQQLAQFAQALEQDPVSVWLEMGERIQQSGEMSELDYDALKGIATGQDAGDEPAAAAEAGDEGEVPPWAQELRQELESVKGETQAEKQARQQRVEQELLKRSIDGIKAKLTEAGMEAPADDREIVAKLIAYNGDVEAAGKSFVEHRDAVLKGFAEKGKSTGKKDLEMPEGSPKAPERAAKTDSWGDARAGAENFLAKQSEAEAQS